MPATTSTIRFDAKLLRPATPGRGPGWTFLLLPHEASARLPSRSRTSVEGLFNGVAFRATLEPDGKGGHWLKVERRLQEAAGAGPGDLVALELRPAAVESEPVVPADLRRALVVFPKARAVWKTLTPIARRDWIHWIVSARKAETRARRIANACAMLGEGKRRVCCFDRSGIYGGGMAAPEPAPDDGG